METILITGGSGYFGRNLARHLKGSYHVILGGRNAGNNDMASRMTGCPAVPLDVANMHSVRDVINTCRPDIIIHAAATKYVDRSQAFPNECMDINILGSQNVARSAIDKGIRLVIGISTDKAASPSKSLYGLSKEVMEKYFCLMDGKAQTRFFCTRFGNIAWSTGSVFPIWKTMLEKTGVIETTGYGMRRFMISVDEACEIVMDTLNAAEIPGGMILTRTMSYVNMSTALDEFIRVYGGMFTRIPARQGENKTETVIAASEACHTSTKWLNGRSYLAIDPGNKDYRELGHALDADSAEEMPIERLQELIGMVDVPEIC